MFGRGPAPWSIVSPSLSSINQVGALVPLPPVSVSAALSVRTVVLLKIRNWPLYVTPFLRGLTSESRLVALGLSQYCWRACRAFGSEP
jgi:hypothetical protein